MKRFTQHPLSWILILAVVLRLFGLWHGFPFLYHPDEPVLINETLALPLHRLNPGHFDWPHFHYYLTAAFLSPLVFLQLLLGKSLTDITDNLVPFYFLGRFLTLIMGVGTVYLVYLSVKRLFSEKEALLAALFLTLNVTHVAQSQVATLDVPMTFWLMLSFYFSVLVAKDGRLRDYLLAGFFAGLATSTKYNAALIVLCLLGAHWYRYARVLWPGTVKDLKSCLLSFRSLFTKFHFLAVSGLVALLAFFIGTPFALLDAKTFLSVDGPEGALWQFSHVGSKGLSMGVLERYTGLFTTILLPAMGILLTLTAIVGLVIILKKERLLRFILVPFVLIYFFYLGTFSKSPQHYYLPLFSFFSLLAAVGFNRVSDEILHFFTVSKSKWELGTKVVLALLVLGPLTRSVYADYVLTQKDTRTQAYEWINENIPPGTGIVLGNDYEPILDNTRYPLYDIHKFLLNEDLSKPIYSKFLDRGIKYGVLGDYDLGERVNEARWNPREPVYPNYLLDEAGVVKRFDPMGHPGPVVMIFEIDYKYEVLEVHKEWNKNKKLDEQN